MSVAAGLLFKRWPWAFVAGDLGYEFRVPNAPFRRGRGVAGGQSSNAPDAEPTRSRPCDLANAQGKADGTSGDEFEG
jgi:hypothetical protein